tara:strand:+ start:1974 stop:2153 length:180 start_codon:yes stop_codon:yes gene_type:complete
MRITASKGFLRQVKRAMVGKVLMWDWVNERWIVGDRDKVKRFSKWTVVIKDFSETKFKK